MSSQTRSPGGLGRIIIPDERDHRFPLLAATKDQPTPDRPWRYWWDRGWWGDQGDTPRCVAFAWLHLIEDGPETWAPRAPGEGPVTDPTALYRAAQLVDTWPGEDYEGTSVRAGAKVLQAAGFIESYRWGFTLAELVEAVLLKGPAVVGTWWYDGMDEPDEEGFVHVSGAPRGGHAYLVNGVNLELRRFRIKNSWGRSWGLDGRAWISFPDMERLIHEQGEVCLPIEVSSSGRREVVGTEADT